MVILLTKEEGERLLNFDPVTNTKKLMMLVNDFPEKVKVYQTKESDQFILELTIESYIDIIKQR